MRILLIGSGGREHALAWKLGQSARLERLYASPGNPGIAKHGELVSIDPMDHAAVLGFARDHRIDLVVIGPEQPLVDGLADALTAGGVAVFGPSAAAAMLEGSKTFTKTLCSEAGIPTAPSASFTDRAEADAHIKAVGVPIVIKADGLAAGKGVVVAGTLDEALEAIAICFASGDGAIVVIEEMMTGTEASLFALSDGETVIPFGTAQDYKRAYDGDMGPNTGGMGAISPAPALPPRLVEQAMKEIVRPTIAAMKARGTPFCGVLYAGLMVTADGPKLIEYNVRFGDPECQVLMPRLLSDLPEVLMATGSGRLFEVEPEWSDEIAVTVILANPGYPGEYTKGAAINGLDAASELSDVIVFHAGTSLSDGQVTATGGRVIAVTGTGPTPPAARKRAYEGVSLIDWPGAHYRNDIGRPDEI